MCPYFGHSTLTSEFKVYAFCRCCRHTTKISNHHSKSEKISKLPFSFVAKLFFTCKTLYVVNAEVWARCPKLGHATKYFFIKILFMKWIFIPPPSPTSAVENQARRKRLDRFGPSLVDQHSEKSRPGTLQRFQQFQEEGGGGVWCPPFHS